MWSVGSWRAVNDAGVSYAKSVFQHGQASGVGSGGLLSSAPTSCGSVTSAVIATLPVIAPPRSIVTTMVTRLGQIWPQVAAVPLVMKRWRVPDVPPELQLTVGSRASTSAPSMTSGSGPMSAEGRYVGGAPAVTLERGSAGFEDVAGLDLSHSARAPA